jgi:hypothetical protein
LHINRIEKIINKIAKIINRIAKTINRIAKIGFDHLFRRKIDLSFDKLLIIEEI